MGSLADPTTESPIRTESVNGMSGVFSGVGNIPTLYVWDSPSGGQRLLAVGQRDVIADALLYILIDEKEPHLLFRPGAGLVDGGPKDIVFGSTKPLNAKTTIKIEVESDHERIGIATFDVEGQSLAVQTKKLWNVLYGFPFTPASAESARRQREVTTLLSNFKALKSHWPQLRAPTVGTEKNVSTPIPDVEHRVRIAGKVAPGDLDGSRFIDHGYAQVKSLLSIAEVYGCKFSAATTVLDWGVGCGRIARHIPPLLHEGLVGIDVDSKNIAWCKENIPFGRFETIDPFTRTEFEDGKFDLIYSLSVLTHLSEPDQFHWLEELARISRGIMILSVTALFGTHSRKWARSPEKLWRYLFRGFSFDNKNLAPAIDDVTPSGYYRSTSHTPAYIYANWSRFLEVVDVIPGGVGARQDAVICRPLRPK